MASCWILGDHGKEGYKVNKISRDADRRLVQEQWSPNSVYEYDNLERNASSGLPSDNREKVILRWLEADHEC